MSASRDRKEAARRLGIALQQRYDRLVTAGNTEEVQHAAIDLGACFNENIEYVIWVLKTYGGLTPPLPQKHAKPAPAPPVNGLPVLPPVLVGNDK